MYVDNYNLYNKSSFTHSQTEDITEKLCTHVLDVMDNICFHHY